MIRRAAALMLLAAGCSPQPHLEPPLCTGAACVGLAMATLADVGPAPVEPKRCCGKCGKGGLPPGKIRSGDGVAIISCGCEPECACMKAGKSCQTGSCK